MNSLFKFCHQLQLQTNLLKPRFDLSLQFVRDSGGARRKLPYPTKKFSPWLTKQHKVQHDEHLTKENREFIQEVIKDRFPQASPLGAPGSPLKDKVIEPATDVEWDPKLKRTGVLAKKIGVVPLWMKDGTKVLSTMLQVIDNHVIKYIPPEEYNPVVTGKKDYEVQKYGCMIVGAQGCDPQKFTKEYCGLFSEAGVMPKRRIARFQVSPEAALQPGTPLVAAHFRPGEHIDARGKTMNRGFHGVMKRWGFAGMPATHGVTKTHRRPGCIGHGAGKGNVLPGKKMPGHMGNRSRMIRGLRILRINTKYNVIWTLGQAIPGSTNSYIYIYDTLLKEKRKEHNRSFPTFIAKPDEVLPDDLWAEDVHRWDEPTIEYKSDN